MSSLLRNLSLSCVIVVVSAYGLAALRGPNGLPALTEKRRHIQTLQENNASLAADNLRKKERIELLKTSRPAQDLEIRERLKLLRPGETQFILPETPKETSESPVAKP